MNEQRANEELNIELEYERVKEQRYKAFQEWLNECPLVVTDYHCLLYTSPSPRDDR